MNRSHRRGSTAHILSGLQLRQCSAAIRQAISRWRAAQLLREYMTFLPPFVSYRRCASRFLQGKQCATVEVFGLDADRMRFVPELPATPL